MPNPTPFVYEVNLAIHPSAVTEFEQWLKPHIEEMLGFEGFLHANWYTRRAEDEGNDKEVVLWTIHYHLSSQNAFDRYLQTHAERMRAEGLQRFSGVFTATRRLLHTHRNFI